MGGRKQKALLPELETTGERPKRQAFVVELAGASKTIKNLGKKALGMQFEKTSWP